MGLVCQTAKSVFSQMGTSVDFKVGTMIEIPRAALVADEVSLQYLDTNKPKYSFIQNFHLLICFDLIIRSQSMQIFSLLEPMISPR